MKYKFEIYNNIAKSWAAHILNCFQITIIDHINQLQNTAIHLLSVKIRHGALVIQLQEPVLWL